MGDKEVSPLTAVASVWDILEAEMIVGRLAEAGIDATVRSESLSTVLGLTVDGLGRRDVLVRDEDAERALEILSESTGDEAEPGE